MREEEIISDDFHEIKAFERVGGPNAMLGTIDKAIQDPLERFQTFVDAIARSLDGQGIILPFNGQSIGEKDIQIMLENAHKLKYIQFKNPTAYVLGYIASNNGTKITIKSVKYVIDNVLKLNLQGNIQPPDVLRYARLWEEL